MQLVWSILPGRPRPLSGLAVRPLAPSPPTSGVSLAKVSTGSPRLSRGSHEAEEAPRRPSCSARSHAISNGRWGPVAASPSTTLDNWPRQMRSAAWTMTQRRSSHLLSQSISRPGLTQNPMDVQTLAEINAADLMDVVADAVVGHYDALARLWCSGLCPRDAAFEIVNLSRRFDSGRCRDHTPLAAARLNNLQSVDLALPMSPYGTTLFRVWVCLECRVPAIYPSLSRCRRPWWMNRPPARLDHRGQVGRLSDADRQG